MNRIRDEGRQCEAFRREVRLDADKLDTAVRSALQKIDLLLEKFTYKFPGSNTRNNMYDYRKPFVDENPTNDPVEEGGNFDWTTGFWTGMIWLAYELTGDDKYRAAAEIHVDSFRDRIERNIDCDTHDLGFLYTLSCVAAFKLTGNRKAEQTALLAADRLMTRYFPKAGIIQAHGDLNDPRLRGRMIIDGLMNLPLLYWAAEATGRPVYREAAETHARQTMRYIVREDASTYHTYYFDVESGEPRYGDTLQGYSDDSCWSRGQAWGIYGFTLSYVYTGERRFLETAMKLADYFLNRLPGDRVVYWDLIFTDDSGEEKDSSASAIAVCGLLEMARRLPEGEERSYYRNAALSILGSLIDGYATIGNDQSNALLLHSVNFKKAGRGVDEACLWGDYFYLEALVRMKRDWSMYW